MQLLNETDFIFERFTQFNKWGGVPMLRISHRTTRKTRTYNNNFHPEHQLHWTKKLRTDIEAGAFA